MKQIFRQLVATLEMLTTEAHLAGTSFPKLLVNVLYFCARTGLGPRYYVVCGMARKGFVAKDKWQHVSARRYYRALEILNPRTYRKLTQHKVSEKALYQLMHIPTAHLIGYFHCSAGFDRQGNALSTLQELEGLLRDHKGQKVCIKPVEGWGGTCVLVGSIELEDDAPFVRCHPGKVRLNANQLLECFAEGSRRPEFLVEEYLQQSGEFMAFNPDSLNTLRLWVLESILGEPQVIGAYLRVGRAGVAIDNASAGGIMFPVDLATGRLDPGLTKHSPHREDLHAHPDHHGEIAGHRLQSWQTIVDFSTAVLARLPHTRFAGLDVAMTETGPVLVETNVAPDKDGAAHANIPSILIWQAARKRQYDH